jgi:hypothetical protein
MKTQTTASSIGGTRGGLKPARLFFLPGVLLLGFAALAPTSNAQAKLIGIKNEGTETVKVCVYKAHDSTFRFFQKDAGSWAKIRQEDGIETITQSSMFNFSSPALLIRICVIETTFAEMRTKSRLQVNPARLLLGL